MTANLFSYQEFLDTEVEALMRRAVDDIESSSPDLATMIRYHLGWVDESLKPTPQVSAARGKRVRPLIALLACASVSGEIMPATPVAAGIEMFHNFTLVHDDIQDHSPVRRHRPTVWHRWGIAQAINVGDAMFALSQTLLLQSPAHGLPADTTLELAERFNVIAAEIVAGQSLDIIFESKNDISPSDHLSMIRRKTAVLLGFAAWSGALAGGASNTDAFRHFGIQLGLSFQIQDDLLGIWGDSAETGKNSSDDIRHKKKSLPIVELISRSSPADAHVLFDLYDSTEIDEPGAARILSLLEQYRIRNIIEHEVQDHHRQALSALRSAIPDLDKNQAGLMLESLTNSLLHRDR